jgi:hypothetical protein
MRRLLDDDRLRRVHHRTRHEVADIDAAVEAGLADADADIGLGQGRESGGGKRHTEDKGFHGFLSI